MYKKEYTEQVKRTESLSYQHLDPRVVHAVIGICTEAVEMLDALKKSMFYGKPLDVTNLFEERGDLEWYTAVLDDALGFDENEIRAANIAKLKARYPDKFTLEAATNRDLVAERAILDSALGMDVKPIIGGLDYELECEPHISIDNPEWLVPSSTKAVKSAQPGVPFVPSQDGVEQ